MQLLTIPEAAERLSVSRATIYRLIEAGQLRTVQVGVPNVGGRRFSKTRVRADDLADFIEKRTSSALP